MRVKATIWFPETVRNEEEIELEIPDEFKGYEEDYFCEEAEKIFSDAGFEGTDIYGALDMSVAGYKNIKAVD